MVGLGSMLLELALPLCATAMLVALLPIWIRRRTWKNAVPVLVLVVFAGLVDGRFYFQLQRRAELRALSATGIRSVYIAGQWHRDARLGEAVVDALRKSDWFSMSHGGVGAFQWLIVEYEDGREARFRVAEYHRGPGAVLSFGRPPGGSAFHDGYAIARDLPAALARFGLSLEAKRTAASTRGDQRRP